MGQKAYYTIYGYLPACSNYYTLSWNSKRLYKLIALFTLKIPFILDRLDSYFNIIKNGFTFIPEMLQNTKDLFYNTSNNFIQCYAIVYIYQKLPSNNEDKAIYSMGET